MKLCMFLWLSYEVPNSSCQWPAARPFFFDVQPLHVYSSATFCTREMLYNSLQYGSNSALRRINKLKFPVPLVLGFSTVDVAFVSPLFVHSDSCPTSPPHLSISEWIQINPSDSVPIRSTTCHAHAMCHGTSAERIPRYQLRMRSLFSGMFSKIDAQSFS